MSDAIAEASPSPASSETSYPTFDSFPVSDGLKAAIAALGFTKPTDVQAAVIGPMVAGRDVVAQARTGSGKTLAFGIPMFERLPDGAGKASEPAALVLVPTRELAHQVGAALRTLATYKQLRVQAVYGGAPLPRQTMMLKSGVDILVGTPGRLLDHVRRRNVSLAALRMVVLDEADEMLSMGFWDDVTDILKMSPSTRQTMLFSATLPYDVAKAAAQFLREPVRIDVSGDELSVDGISNTIYHVLAELPKPRQLLYVLEAERPESTIIFCNTRNETDMIAKFLTQAGFIAEPLSGNMRQKDRERVMGRIKAGDLRYMVATDVAARGIDINDLSHVFNYSLPEFPEVYLHRVGRTGRIGKLGAAVSLIDGVGLATLTRLEREFGISFTEKVLPAEETIIRTRSERIMKELADKASVSEVGQHLPIAQHLVESPNAAQMVAYLLKFYFNTQASDGERRSQQAQDSLEPRSSDGERAERAPERERERAPQRERESAPQRERAPRPEGQAVAPGEVVGEGGEAGRGRRRRRRGRGRGGRPAENGPSDTQPAFETMDIEEALGPARTRAASGAPAQPTAAPHAPGVADVASLSPEVVQSALANGGGVMLDAGGQAVLPPDANVDDGYARLRVNVGFDDGFKGRGAVAKRIAALAGLNEGSVLEVESRREYSVLKATPHIAELVIDRVDGTPIGKKVLTVALAQ